MELNSESHHPEGMRLPMIQGQPASGVRKEALGDDLVAGLLTKKV